MAASTSARPRAGTLPAERTSTDCAALHLRATQSMEGGELASGPSSAKLRDLRGGRRAFDIGLFLTPSVSGCQDRGNCWGQRLRWTRRLRAWYFYLAPSPSTEGTPLSSTRHCRAFRFYFDRAVGGYRYNRNPCSVAAAGSGFGQGQSQTNPVSLQPQTANPREQPLHQR